MSCPGCGRVQHLPCLVAPLSAHCQRCGTTLQRTAGRNAQAALAFALASVGVLLPGLLLPLLVIPLGGSTQTMTVFSSIWASCRDGEWIVGVVLSFMLVVVPLLRLGLLIRVLAVVLGRSAPPQQAGVWLRWATALRLWSAVPVFVVALAAVYSRMNVQLTAELGLGAWALLAFLACSAGMTVTLDTQQIWDRIRPPGRAPRHGLGCESCQYVSEAGRSLCERCRRPLEHSGVVNTTAALVVTSGLLYIPCYIYPMTVAQRPTGPAEHTIVDGIVRLIQEGFWYLAGLIVFASVLIPALKLLGLGWMLFRARAVRSRFALIPDLRSREARRLTRAHWIIDEIGRWSMVDPMIAAGTAGLVHLQGVAEVHVGPSATPFTLVVVLTMMASKRFDPRLVWQQVHERS